MRKIGKIFRFLLPVIALVALVVFMTGAGRRERATLEKNKAIVTRYGEEVWNKGNMAVVDEIVASDYSIRHVFSGDLHGREALKQFIREVRTIWPDFHCTSEMMIAEGDKVMVRWRNTGTHTGTGWGIPPTGNKCDFMTHIIHRIADGKIVEEWEVAESVLIDQQMGFKLVPAK